MSVELRVMLCLCWRHIWITFLLSSLCFLCFSSQICCLMAIKEWCKPCLIWIYQYFLKNFPWNGKNRLCVSVWKVGMNYWTANFFHCSCISFSGVLEEAEFYNVTEAIALIKERIKQRDSEKHQQQSGGKNHMYRVLQCQENELVPLITTLSDGWEFEQVS